MRIGFPERVFLNADWTKGPGGLAQGSKKIDRARGVVTLSHFNPWLDVFQFVPSFAQRSSYTDDFFLQGSQPCRPGVLVLHLRS